MKPSGIGVILCLVILAWRTSPVLALPEEKDPLRPRVPLEKRLTYKSLSSPIYSNSRSASREILESGEKVYECACSNCHGASGDGTGHSGTFLPVKPRDFTNCTFQKKRADGEFYYVMKFGSWPMPPMIPLITKEEAWVAYIRNFCHQAPRDTAS